jgi:hypothetical protein
VKIAPTAISNPFLRMRPFRPRIGCTRSRRFGTR